MCRRFLWYVESLPSSVPPDVFGLHTNADISKVGTGGGMGHAHAASFAWFHENAQMLRQ